MIKLVNVSKYYSSNSVIALGLRKVNLELYRNEFVAIVGESGSGKTTLLNVISGIDSYEEGEMYVNGKETSYYSVSDMEDYRKNYVAFVFQNYNLIDSYTVLQNVEAPLILSGFPKDKIRKRALEIIKRVGLEKHIHHKATKLSGGQKQRVVIARALAKDCPIIAADEPTGNLDSESAKQVIELLQEIAKEKLVIIVTHDFSQVEKYATRKIRIFDGEVVEDLNLRKVDKLDLPTIDKEENKIRFTDFLSISIRNLLAVPKKTVLMVIVFTFFSFFVALTYGAYQLILNETNINSNSVFGNSNPNRIVVRKDDNSAFTQEDLDELAGYKDVVEVVSFDYVLDDTVSLFYEDEDTYNYLNGSFLPISLISESDLEYGRMPEADNEIVIAVSSAVLSDYEEYIGITFSSSFSDYYEGSSEAYKIVGMIDISILPTSTNSSWESFYFGTDSSFEALKKELYLQNTIKATFTEIALDEEIIQFINYSDFKVDSTLPDNEIRVSSYNYRGTCELDVCYVTGDLSIVDYYTTNNIDDITMAYDVALNDDLGYFYVNQNTYDLIFYDDIYQVSLLTDTGIGVSSLVRQIQRIQASPLNFKYHVTYPFDSQASEDFSALLMLMSSIGLIVLNVVVLIGSTLITYVIFRAIINTKLPDYAIFRTIGANKDTIKKFIYFENFYIVIVSYIIFLVVSIALPDSLVINTPFYALKVFKFGNYIVFLILLFVMALIISRRYCNRIFSKTVQNTLKSDLG